MSFQKQNRLKELILHNVYAEKIALLRKINSTGILPYLPDDLILYITQFLVSTTDYIDYYIEKIYTIEQTQFDIEILPYIVQLHNYPNKKEICKNWDYGEEFLLISKRHEDGDAFYSSWNNCDKSFLCDLEMQIKCISKPRSKIINKKLLDYIMPINKILRIDYKSGMMGIPHHWEKDLGPYFQKILSATIEEQKEIFSIWNSSYANSFKLSQIDHSNGKKEYYSYYPETSLMCSFITSFMMYEYH